METTVKRIPGNIISQSATVIKCIGHPLRLRLLEALELGEKTVSELQEYSGASQATVSQQLATLRGRNVVTCRRQGPHVYYWIIEPNVTKILDCIRSCVPEEPED